LNLLSENGATKMESMIILNELSYFGKRKEEIFSNLDNRFGEREWSLKWFIKNEICEQSEAIKHYENSYFEFLKNNGAVLEWLINNAGEVYDNDISNIKSGLDYSIQECSATHLQDIAVRNVLKKLGRTFKGDHPIQIRGSNSEGYILNPGQVSFYRPEIILPSNIKSWWKNDSVEAFYQHNKALVVNSSSLSLTPEIECPNGDIIFRYNKQMYYRLLKGSNILKMIKGKHARRLINSDKSYKRI
tara:strand:- start:3015 stop:3749 length:735 start_codon:yes stop_codon:yes gene_type:complete